MTHPVDVPPVGAAPGTPPAPVPPALDGLRRALADPAVDAAR